MAKAKSGSKKETTTEHNELSASLKIDVNEDSASGAAKNTLRAFAETAERVAATTKKLEKAATLGAYFHQLDDENLIRAARYFAGHQFAMNDARTTNVGSSVIRDALSQVTGFGVDDLRPRYVRLGDAGDVAFEAFTEAGRIDFFAPDNTDGMSFTLTDTESLIALLSDTRGTKNKKEIVTQSLRKLRALEAKYLVKMLLGDLRIGLKEGLVEDAIARAFEQPLARVAYVNMLTGDIGETAVRARRGDLEDVSMQLFHPLKFMLATAAADAADVERTMPEGFFIEDKFDGIRAQAHVSNGRVAIYSRTLDEISHRFPETHDALINLPTDAILDGELVPSLAGKILPFAELQKRLGRKTVSDELLAQTPVVFVAYDVLYADGKILLDEPLSERRRILETLVRNADDTDANDGAGALRLSHALFANDVSTLDAEFDLARGRGNEGLMVKDPRSLYKPGRRGREWLKIKRALATLDVVVTSVEVGHGRRRHLLSDFTFAVRRSETDDELLNVGKAYSGLTDVELAGLTEWFRAHTVQEFAHGRVRTVEPEIVLEVTFDRVQESKRHKSGFALRFPRILRLREDKTVAEIDTLASVRALIEMTASDDDKKTVGGRDTD